LIHIAFHTLDGLPPLRNELIMLSRCGIETAAIVLPGASEPELPHIRVIPVRIALRRISTKQTPILKLFRYAEYMLRLFFILMRSPGRLMVAHDPITLPAVWLVARLRRRKLIYNAHELWSGTDAAAAPMPGLWKMLDRFFCKRVDDMIAPEENRIRIYKDELGARRVPVLVRNCPIYRERVHSDILRGMVRGQGGNTSCIVLYQGLVAASRCLRELVMAVARAREPMSLVIMGKGDDEYAASLKRLVVELECGDRVFFHPAIPYGQLHPYTCSADIGVLLYSAENRNNIYCAPNKIYEYMQAGLLLLASNSPGLTRLMADMELGLCVDPMSTEALSQALDVLAIRIGAESGDQRANRLAGLARDSHSWEGEFAKLLSLYAEYEVKPANEG
jgi:glycosyltransferase involved in cell wall biosynthesis